MGFGPGPGHMRQLASLDESRAADATGALLRLAGYLRPYLAQVLAVLALVVLTTLLQLAGPYLIGLAIDQFIARQDAPGLTWTMLLLLGTYLLSWGSSAAQFYLMAVVSQNVLYALRTQIFQQVQTLSLRFFAGRESGDLMSRLVNDVDVLNQVLNAGIIRILGDVLILVGIVLAMLALNWRLALASFNVLPLMVIATRFFSQRALRAFRRTRETIGAVSAELQENLAAIREVQAFAREDENRTRFAQLSAANRDANVQAVGITSAFSPTLDVLSTVAMAIVVGVGGYLVLNDLATVGVIVAFITYVRRFYEPIRSLAQLYTQFQSAIAAAERIFELVDTQPDLVDAPDAVVMPPIRGRVEFDHVSFWYQEGTPVLQDVSLVAEPGQTVAIVGPTGTGKTTLVNLIGRFYDVTWGAVRIDGYDVRRVQAASLRRQMGIVLQDTFLFAGTVRENIRYGRLDATDEEVEAAARLVNAHQFIERLPQGYDTMLTERGANLSQGQRQLIAFARAILADPRILILDEATSSVDTRTEMLIQQALAQLLAGRTSFVIAHRLSTIRNADQVLMLVEGRIVERGRHDELMAARGPYHDMYMSQFRRQEGSAEANARVTSHPPAV